MRLLILSIVTIVLSFPTIAQTKVKLNCPDRIILIKPDLTPFSQPDTCVISLMLNLSSNGSVIRRPMCVKSLTTCTSDELIEKVTDAVYNELKFSECDVNNDRIVMTFTIPAIVQ